MTLEEARASLEAGDLERAREGLQRAIEADPNDSSALVDLGYLALGAGNTDDAAELFRQALEREPGNIDALRAISTIHGRSGRSEDAFDAASAVAEAQPDDPLAALELAELALEHRPAGRGLLRLPAPAVGATTTRRTRCTRSTA